MILDALRLAFARKEEIRITDVGAADLFGNAPVILSDGSAAYSRYPVVGRIFAVVTHEPEVVPLENEDAWRVTPWNEEPRIVRASELL